jgi:ankyrin repeat protein
MDDQGLSTFEYEEFTDSLSDEDLSKVELNEQLIVAIIMRCKPRVVRLLERGADPDTALGFCLATAAEDGELEIMSLLINNGADVNIGNGYPLRSAMRAGKKKSIELLIENGAVGKS